jgi:hypothetical protein
MSDVLGNLMRVNGRVINFGHVKELQYCNKQVYILYVGGEETLIKDKEEVAAIGEYLSGLLPNIVNHEERQRMLGLQRVMRQQMYREAAMLSVKLGEEVTATPGPGFAGHKEHVPLTQGGDPRPSERPTPSVMDHDGHLIPAPPGQAKTGPGCCGKKG